MKQDVVLMGPFVGEFYWEAGRFAPLLPAMRARKYKDRDVKYVVFTREERFDLYGKYADILIPHKTVHDRILDTFDVVKEHSISQNHARILDNFIVMEKASSELFEQMDRMLEEEARFDDD